ncbi:hypothetical protein [Cellvibrio sp. PSBB006]|uniref:hypothetical protein n=1 Tax=Cellvibrio sp. PSBB006 TaxID=1987723 RepID=UPI000B3B5063|nr:hypothetical protein [Cellvibrio sp. PSBB006]ARU26075.1 hypothetical protein CBR65_00740 [Cellvibrio sp. PSBB006]
MRFIQVTLTLALTMGLFGCTNLKEVQDFAGQSAKLSGYTELTTRFRDTYYREQPYLSCEADRIAQENDARRKAAYKDLLTVHQSVTVYMQTLATLAGDDSFDLSPGIDSLSSGIKTHPDLGIDKAQVDAISGLAKVISKWATSSYQQRAVRNFIQEGNEPLQTTLAGMERLIDYYQKTNDNEWKTIKGLLEVELLFTDQPESKLLATLARAHTQDKAAEYQLASKKYTEAKKGVQTIAKGHQLLVDNLDKLSKQEIKDSLRQFSKDVRAINNHIESM